MKLITTEKNQGNLRNGNDGVVAKTIVRARRYQPRRDLEDEDGARSAELIPASSITPTNVRWHWRGWVPANYITVVAGDGGVGKGMLSVWLTAQASTGAPLPGGVEREPIRTLVVCDEDGIADVVIPRMLAAKADLDQVTFLDVRAGLFSLPDDVWLIEKSIAKGKFGLVWIDSASSYLSDGLNVNRDQDVRKALMPLAKVARDQQTTILTTWHINKNTENAAGHRITGSTAIRNVARSLILAGQLPQDLGDGYGVAVEKANYAARPPGRGYVIEQRLAFSKPGARWRRHRTARLAWTGELPELDPDDLLPRKQKRGPGRPSDQREAATELLERCLRDGPMAVEGEDGLKAQARHEGISWSTVERAKRQRGGIKVFKKGGPWYWMLDDGKG
jgi:AAA domain